MATELWRNSLRFVSFAAVLLAAGGLAAEPPVYASIDRVYPPVLDPSGGQVVRIDGVFTPPVRVFFDLGQGSPLVEAAVLSASQPFITALVPAVDVEPVGWRLASVVVVAPTGYIFAQRATQTNAVRFERAGLPPNIAEVSPRAVPRTGGRVDFFGVGFQSPLQVFSIHADGSETQMQVLRVDFDHVTALAPGVGGNESVGVRLVNVLSGKTSLVSDAFRYVTPMSIGSVTPNTGPYSGGTLVTIDGSGFADPVAVVVGGIAAQPLEISENRIVAVTGTVSDPQCSDSTGAVNVTRVNDGINTVGTPFTFLTPRSEFRFVPSQATAGSLLNVIVKNDVDQMRFQLDDTLVAIESRLENADGSATYRLRVPASLAFSGSGCLPAPLAMTLRMTNPGTGCRDTRPLFVLPGQESGRCRPLREVQ
jgi:IPT/TIG domain